MNLLTIKGDRRVGKSTLAVSYIKEYAEANPNSLIVILTPTMCGGRNVLTSCIDGTVVQDTYKTVIKDNGSVFFLTTEEVKVVNIDCLFVDDAEFIDCETKMAMYRMMSKDGIIVSVINE